MNQSPELHIVFDALLYLQELLMAGSSVFFKFPDFVGAYPSLKYLTDLSIYLTPPETVFTITTSILLEDILSYFFPFLNCLKSDMHSFCSLKSEDNLKRAFRDNLTVLSICPTFWETNFTVTTSLLEDIFSYFFPFLNCLRLDMHSFWITMNNFQARAFYIPSSRVPMWFEPKRTREAILDIIGTCSSLQYLELKGSCIDSLPASIKNLPLLKTIYLRNCRRLLSIPELPPSVMQLDATNCTSLETIYTITTSATQQKGVFLSYFFSFVNCLKLDEHSLCNIMDSAYLSLKQAVHNNFDASDFCYSSSRVPNWFSCKETTEASIAMQLSPSVDELLGFVFCAVLPQSTSNIVFPSYLECLCCSEDGEKIEGSSKCYSITELYSDHVFLWYDPYYFKQIIEGLKTKLGKGEDVPKVSFEFYVVTYDYGRYEGLIKECGVHPIYASEQQMEPATEL